MSKVDFLTRGWQLHLRQCLTNKRRCLFISSPFVAIEGCELVRDSLSKQFQQEGRLAILAGLSPVHLLQQSTDPRALQFLLGTVAHGSLRHLPRIHAKVFVFDQNYAVVTSANLTAGGLYRNI